MSANTGHPFLQRYVLGVIVEMDIDTGWNMRLEILRRDAEQKVLEPLRKHGWAAAIEGEFKDGELLILSAERGGHRHRVALLYSSATGNQTYKQLAQQVEHIYFNGQPYQVESYAHGIQVPVSCADDFHLALVEWNASSVDGKFAPTTSTADRLTVKRPDHRVLLTEEPIEAVWLRIRQLHSVTLAKKLIAARAEEDGITLSEAEVAVDLKAEGLAYATRNAHDYYTAKASSPVSQRILNLYYGSLAFATISRSAAPSMLEGSYRHPTGRPFLPLQSYCLHAGCDRLPQPGFR
jgi:hypothetical protein